MLIDASVADDIDAIDSGRFALVHTHLEVDRVILYSHFDRLHVEEEITTVVIEFSHGIVVLLQTFVEQFEVIGVTFLDTECSIQKFVRINGIADPRDVADVVFVTLAHGQVDIHTGRIFGIGHYAVGYDIGIAITDLVVLGDNGILVLLVLFGNEFLGTEEIGDVVIVGFLHRPVDLGVRQSLVTGDIDFCDLGFGLFVHIDDDFYVTGLIAIRKLHHLHFGIMETLVGQEFLDNGLCTIAEVRRHLIALGNTHLHFQIFLLTFLEAVVRHFRNTRTRCERNLEPYLTRFHLSGFNLDI